MEWTGVATSLHRASGPTSSTVVRYERSRRTFARGKANEHGFLHVCVLWQGVARDQLNWPQCERKTRRPQVRIVKVPCRDNRRDTGSAHVGPCSGLSRVEGNFHVRVLGGGGGGTALPSPPG